VFGESYASLGRIAAVIPVTVAVPGCPPAPRQIIQGIVTAVQATRESLAQRPPQVGGMAETG
ncbi:MAG TPA: hypothetical protein VK043_10950, partial [Burkholderiales bacterium]|nr:hypothetical protein [Burkholderiales bacterium]